MAKVDNQVQGDLPTYIFKCYCGENSYLEIMQDPEDKELYISITQHPTRLRERLKLAWKALRGLEFTAAGDIILLDDDVKKLIKALEFPAVEGADNED